MNHLGTHVPDGGNIMQGIQVAGLRHTLLLSVKWHIDGSMMTYMTRKSTRKQQAIKELLENNKIITRKTCRTYVSQSSVDNGTIVYIFH